MKKVKITGTRYVLAVKDLNKAVKFYRKELGFKTSWSADGWHSVYRDSCTVMLGECPDEQSAFDINNHSYIAYIEVKNIDLLFSEYSSREIEILSTPESKPWGQREFSIRTIDGHRILFGEEI
ncbi:MAG TPA: VOC family protein [Eudoraea sp.]|nr:VOC family protein [Eudoraea sp.]